MYVPGTLAVNDEDDAARVIVDVGTGYYVENTVPEAENIYKGKVAYVSQNVEKLQQTIERKQDNLRVVGEILQVVSCRRPLRCRRPKILDKLTWAFVTLAARTEDHRDEATKRRPTVYRSCLVAIAFPALRLSL